MLCVPYLLYCGLYVDVVDVVDSSLLHLTITPLTVGISRTPLCSTGTFHLKLEHIDNLFTLKVKSLSQINFIDPKVHCVGCSAL